MASNSVAPSRKTLDLYLDGADWKVDVFAEDGTTQIADATIGNVAVDASSIVAIPLDLRELGGDAAHELRIHDAGVIKVYLADPPRKDFPVSALTVVNGEIIGAQIEKIIDIGAGITRVRISWG